MYLPETRVWWAWQLKGTGVFSFIEKSRVSKEAAVNNAPKKPPASKPSDKK